jgi:hypothetical protein
MLSEQQMTDIQFNPEKYLPLVMYTIGCHCQRMTKVQVKTLISELNYEMRQREMFSK